LKIENKENQQKTIGKKQQKEEEKKNSYKPNSISIHHLHHGPLPIDSKSIVVGSPSGSSSL